ncbi:hypothetical protein Taro_024873 [Colocasia esculenta]|uniref:Uncharacterized protein n=1 Tax=Colocasia esculenta TaxID=4460 RepID=A0A843V7Z3_COLES|nr:hypothetical protein [Colocasia esculenta]
MLLSSFSSSLLEASHTTYSSPKREPPLSSNQAAASSLSTAFLCSFLGQLGADLLLPPLPFSVEENQIQTLPESSSSSSFCLPNPRGTQENPPSFLFTQPPTTFFLGSFPPLPFCLFQPGKGTSRKPFFFLSCSRNQPKGVGEGLKMVAMIRRVPHELAGAHKLINRPDRTFDTGVKVVDTCFMTCGLLRWPASRPTGNSVGLVSSSGDVDYVDVVSSRPTGNSVGLVSSSGDVDYLQDLRKTPSAWFHHLGTSIMLTSTASRPTGNSVDLVSSSGDVDYVDVVSFKTYGKFCRLFLHILTASSSDSGCLYFLQTFTHRRI